MRIQLLASAAAISAAAALTVGTGIEPSKTGGSATANATPIALAPDATIQPDEAARLAKQASFGPTLSLVDDIVRKKTAAAWLDEQFGLATSSYGDIAKNLVTSNVCAPLTGAEFNTCYRNNFTATPVQMRFYANAIGGEDQLRQRTAFALSQIIVASEVESHSASGLATFNELLLKNAFGNYRDILKAVTLNAYMGDYLDMADSSKAQPNENYAREFMQLFSVGTVLLNLDGTAQTDNTGAPIATYTNTEVKEVARALTGWTVSRFGGAALTDSTHRDWSRPMIPSPTRFDAGSKAFLGRTIQANASQETNVDAVVDAVFYHPNIAPFICKKLIQQLTLSNPTPGYVERVAKTFLNNGAGVRGDLRSVIRAIYLDPEARAGSQLPGKIKEPVLLATGLVRAIGYATDGYAFTTRDVEMGQAPFRAPSVFNFYPSDFPLPQGQGLLSPVSKLMTTSTALARHNFVFDWTVGSDTRAEFKPTLTPNGTKPDWSTWEANGTDDQKTLNRINLLLLNGTMTAAQRTALLAAMAQIKDSSPTLQTRKRAQMALYVVASSPIFQVDR